MIRNRSLSDVVLVDNSVYSFGYQVDNGIPIISFYNDPRDEELLHLAFYIQSLLECEDVREQNRIAFGLHKLGIEEEDDIFDDLLKPGECIENSDLQFVSD